MPNEAQAYIDQWNALALVAGYCAALGAAVGLIASARTIRTLRIVLKGAHPWPLRLIALGDAALLLLTLGVAFAQIATAFLLVRLSDHYTTVLAPVLVALDGRITHAYLGYTIQAIIVSFIMPTYLAIRALATADRWERDAAGEEPEAQSGARGGQWTRS